MAKCMVGSFGLCYNIDMKKMRQFLYYTMFCLFCLVGMTSSVMGLSKTQEAAILDHCAIMKENLKTVQKNDARTRVYLGGKFEMILNKYVTPLNVRLVENNLSTASLIESQNILSEEKIKFANNYVNYQQKLEELVAVDCKVNPEEFYKLLEEARQRRKVVEQDVRKIRNALTEYVNLVGKVREKLGVKND